MALVPRSLVVYISPSEYNRLVRELQQGVKMSPHSWSCTSTPPWASPRSCQSAPATCYRHLVPCHWPRACVCDLGSREGCETAELEKQAEKHGGTETTRSKSSLAMAEGVTVVMSPPWVRPKRDQNRPPWRYWRRSTPEPQHRKPGEEVESPLTHPCPPQLRATILPSVITSSLVIAKSSAL